MNSNRKKCKIKVQVQTRIKPKRDKYIKVCTVSKNSERGRSRLKKRKFIIILGFLFMAAVLSSSFFKKAYEDDAVKYTEKIMKTCPHYNIDVTFNPETKSIAAFQEVTVVNNEVDPFKVLYFHLYPNAFKTSDTVPFPREDMSRAYPEGFVPGFINIKKVLVKSAEADYEIEDTILKINLNEPLKPKQKLTLTFEFEVQLPPSCGRFGYGKNTFNIANWYPILAVYDEKGWHVEPYYAIGDPFYSEVGLYQVNIKAPKGYTIAASGSLRQKREEGGKTIWSFSTGLVRDFAWIASSNFETAEANVGKTKVTSYYIKGKEEYGREALEFGKKAISCFSEHFGEYPYDDYNIVAADFYIGGMEYPNLVIIGDEFYCQGEFLEYVVVHETAHQWWYGLVGNNQIEEAWLDEALTEYSTLFYYEHYYGKKVGQSIYEKFILNPYRLYEASTAPGPILRHLSEYKDWGDYSATVYYRGAIMLKDLESRLSRHKFHEAIRYYFKQNLYKNATGEDFIKALNHVTGTDWTDYVYDWLKTNALLDKTA